jgi:hypothetical protein
MEIAISFFLFYNSEKAIKERKTYAGTVTFYTIKGMDE